MLFDALKIFAQKIKPVQLARDGLPRFSWYVLSAPQADVKSALMKLLAIRLNEQTTLVKSLVMMCSFRVL
jgi:hypothetical protein